MRRVTRLAVLVAVGLFAIKLAAFFPTQSVSILGSGMDSLLDVLTSAINLFAVHQALQPPDHDHRFGHGKAESIAGLFQCMVIGISAVLLAYESLSHLAIEHRIEEPQLGIRVMGVSLVVTTLLVIYQRRVASRTNSLAIAADSLHYTSDILQNLGVIGSLLASHYLNLYWIDAVFGGCIAVILMRGAWRIGNTAVNELMDKELEADKRQCIYDIALSHPKTLGIHALRTRTSGLRTLIQVHVELDGNLTLGDAHEICDELEAAIIEQFPTADVFIHAEPEGCLSEHSSFELEV
jgi:ferrous-iron efflux pump FieF